MRCLPPRAGRGLAQTPVDSGEVKPGKYTGSGENLTLSAGSQGPLGIFNLTVAHGNLHYDFPSMTMGALAGFLSQLTDLPVVDMTGLEGTFHVPLDISSRDISGSTASFPPGGAGTEEPVPTASEPAGLSIRESLRALGLRLERRTLNSERFVVDHIERTPTAN